MKSLLLTNLLLICSLTAAIAQPANGFFKTRADLISWQLDKQNSIEKVVHPTSALFGDKVVYQDDGISIKANVKDLAYWGCVFDGEVYRFYNGKLYNVLSWGEIMLYGRNLELKRDQELRARSLIYLMGKNEIALEAGDSFVTASMQTVKQLIQANPEAVQLLPDSEVINEAYHNKLLAAINQFNLSKE